MQTLLIDSDIIAFKAASAVQTEIIWPDGLCTSQADTEEARQVMDRLIQKIVNEVGGTPIMCLSCSSRHYYRHDIFPDYKGNRANKSAPMLLRWCKEYLAENYESFERPGLEADDVMGILATSNIVKGEKVIVTDDKDLDTIPGKHAKISDPTVQYSITKAQAEEFLYAQALAGDSTDNIPGCPGIGMDTALKLIRQKIKKVPYEHTLTRGPRKGEVEIRWKEEPTESLVDILVSTYESKGLSVAEATLNLNLVRILDADHYDFKKKEPILD